MLRMVVSCNIAWAMFSLECYFVISAVLRSTLKDRGPDDKSQAAHTMPTSACSAQYRFPIPFRASTSHLDIVSTARSLSEKRHITYSTLGSHSPPGIPHPYTYGQILGETV